MSGRGAHGYCTQHTGQTIYSKWQGRHVPVTCAGAIQAVYARDHGPRGPATKWVSIGRMCLRCWHFTPAIAPRRSGTDTMLELEARRGTTPGPTHVDD